MLANKYCKMVKVFVGDEMYVHLLRSTIILLPASDRPLNKLHCSGVTPNKQKYESFNICSNRECDF